MKKRTKGILAFLLASAMMLTTAVGCGDSSDTGSAGGNDSAGGDGYGDGTGTITMWGWNAGDIDKLFAVYKEDTGADVELDYVTVQQAEAFQKLQTTVSAGLDLPDIVPSEVGQRGTFLDLDIWDVLTDDPYNFDTNMIMDYYIPLISNEDGEVVCLPWDVSTAALAYKKPLAEKYLGTSDPDELAALLPTWDSFVEKGKEVQSASNGEVFMFASLTNIYQIGYGQNPDPIINDDGSLNMDPVNATLELVETFRDNKTADNIVESSPAYSASYADDLHIFYPCASWSPNYQIAPNDPDGIDRWGLMLPPEGCFSWGGSGFLIPTDAKNKLAGFNFCNWMLTKDGTVKSFETCMYFNCNKEAYEDPEFAQMKVENFGDQNLGEILFVEAMDNIEVRPVTKYDVTINDVWTLVVEAMNSDASLDAEAAADMFKTEVGNKAPDLA
jgi:multiple sugar transport system substrate-binding protein